MPDSNLSAWLSKSRAKIPSSSWDLNSAVWAKNPKPVLLPCAANSVGQRRLVGPTDGGWGSDLALKVGKTVSFFPSYTV